MKLPPSPALSAALSAQACSAIGGPVGNFTLQNGKLALVSMRTCSGDLPLGQFYPGAPASIAATWLTGKFRIELDPLCASAAGPVLYATTMHLMVEAGNIVSVKKQARDAAACREP